MVNYFNSIQNKEKVTLVSLISLRSFFRNRRIIKKRLPAAKVFPMFPKPSLWKWNYFILTLLINDKKVMARGPFAASLALRLKKAGKVQKVIFDARGAYKAELNEYNVIPNETIKKEIGGIEKNVVLNADFSLAVSEALVNYWKREFNYNSDKHVVVPCTLSKDFSFDFPTQEKVNQLRRELGYSEKDIVIVYSGSSAGWQSFSLVEKILAKVLEENANVKLLWLTNHTDENSVFLKLHKDRIKKAWVKHEDVKDYLLAGDYGLLYRESSVTNQVASPVKFGEYLICGLNVLISENLGDFSEFVKKNNCGNVGEFNTLLSVSYETKLQNHKLAIQNLGKQNFKGAYLNVLQE